MSGGVDVAAVPAAKGQKLLGALMGDVVLSGSVLEDERHALRFVEDLDNLRDELTQRFPNKIVVLVNRFVFEFCGGHTQTPAYIARPMMVADRETMAANKKAFRIS